MLPPKKTYFFFTIFTGSHGILLNYFWGIIFRTILRNFWRPWGEFQGGYSKVLSCFVKWYPKGILNGIFRYMH